MRTGTKLMTALAVTALVAVGCSSAATTAPAASSAPASSSGSGSGSGLSVTSFDSAFTAMAQLTSVTSAGKGLVGVILPDVTTSARYTSYDLPYLTQAFKAASYATTDF